MPGSNQLSAAAHYLLVILAMNTTSRGKADVVPLHRPVSREVGDAARGLVESLGCSVRPSEALLSAAAEVLSSGYVVVDDSGEMRVEGLPDAPPSRGTWRQARAAIGLELV